MPVTEDELAIVALIGEGLTRWAIADRLELSEATVRGIIRRLCEQYDCPMRDLPDALGIAVDGGRDDDDGRVTV